MRTPIFSTLRSYALLLIVASLFSVLSITLCPDTTLGALPGAPPVDKLLPSPGFANGWTTEGKVETFTKANLYEHINGEAELYMPYGFEAAAAVLYASAAPAKGALAVDLYKMGSLIDAFGIYSNYRNPDAETLRIGGEGFFAATQLMFYQDRYFIQISASGEGTPDRNAFIACAEAIAAKLPAQVRPKEIDLLKAPQVVPNTTKYIAESVLGYAFFKRGLTAEATLDGKTVKAFVVFNDSAAAAQKTLDLYAAYLKGAKVEPKAIEKAGKITLVAQDPLYKSLVLRQSGQYIYGASNLETPEKGMQLLDALEKGK